MKASIPFEFDEKDRRAIARFLGHDGLASHVECVAWGREQMRVSLLVMTHVPKQSSVSPTKEPTP